MNKQRRQRITKVAEVLQEQAMEIESIMDEEQEAFDNTPEGLQESERGEAMQAAIDSLSEALDYVNDANEALESID